MASVGERLELGYKSGRVRDRGVLFQGLTFAPATTGQLTTLAVGQTEARDKKPGAHVVPARGENVGVTAFEAARAASPDAEANPSRNSKCSRTIEWRKSDGL